MTIDLRPHHLLCVLTFAGRGYSDDFTHRYTEIVARMTDGEAIRIVDGPDVICASIMEAEAEPHCLRDSVTKRDEEATASVAALLQRQIATGTEITLTPAIVQTLRAAFESGAIRQACDGCQWAELCSSIAGTGYRKAMLFGKPAARQSNERE